MKIPYDELNKHFTHPKNNKWGGEKKRIPRKLKKKMKSIPEIKDELQCDFLTQWQVLWHYLEYSNPNYKRFLIKHVIENE